MTAYSVASGVWGIARNTWQPGPTQADYDRLIERFRRDLDKLCGEAEAELTFFHAEAALLRWAKLDSQQFRNFAETFLTRLAKQGYHAFFSSSNFAETVAFALFKLDPLQAQKLGAWRIGSTRCQVFVLGTGLTNATRELWRAEFSERPGVADIRRRELEAAQSDEVLLWHVLAARLGGTELDLLAMAGAWRQASVARERALGVLLLGFCGTPGAPDELDRFAIEDSSEWVRETAGWSAEIARRDLAARAAYQDALAAIDLPDLVAHLAVLRPALIPLAYAWMWVGRTPFFTDPRMESFTELF